MPLDIDAFENALSRPTTWTADGGKKTQTREVTVTGYTTPETAANYAVVSGELPTFIPFNPVTLDPPAVLKSVSAKPEGSPEIWIIEGSYESLQTDDNGDPLSYSISGTTSGATTTVTQGILGRYTKYGTGPDYAGAINVDKDGVQGVEIIIPKLEFQIEKVIPRGTLFFQYLQVLIGLTGRVNAAPAFYFAPRELLFLGADFSAKGGGDVTFTYKFAASPNRLAASGNALSVGAITNIEKFGHDYLWVDYKAEESSGYVIRTPRTVHVHGVYEDGDFSLLGI